MYCVRVELFQQYVLPVSLPPKFTLSTLLKVPNAVQNKAVISYTDWVNISASSLGLSESVAGSIFELFCTYTMRAEEKLEHTRDELAWKANKQHAGWLADRTVPLPPFLLFVFCQQHHTPSNSASSQSAWQSVVCQTGSPNGDATLHAMAVDHEKMTTFVTQHLYHLLALLSPNKYKVNFAQVNTFGIVLKEIDTSTAGSAKKDLPFGSLMPFWWTDKSALVDISLVQQHINDGMIPMGPTKCGYKPWTDRNNKVLFWPSEPGHKTAIVRGYVKTMVHKGAELGPDVENTQIYCNHHANIYLLAPMHNVTIFGCTDTNIILGPVSGVVTLESCEKVRLIVPCRGLKIQGAVDCRVYCCTNTPPLVLQGNKHTELAPYNTFYPALEDHLRLVGVNPLLNLWDAPVSLCKADQLGEQVSLLHPELFTSVTVPFTNHAGDTHNNPCSIPAPYMEELKRKVSVATNACNVLRQVATERGGAKAETARQLNERFKLWLQTSGNLRHILELLHYEEES
eukprot:TRINITY_DN8308_c0_g1_i1.p1 TRINITY_DN8308_c0_g1~~TRINITY_DN8308_c0_g1_i1.p1  ORF type:complete len:512 (+),score=110.77 TRINITY_DN8308_c0_g1_i1:43-1578(+)